MTVLELEARKADLVRGILNDVDSEDVLNELSAVFKKLTTLKKTCQHSVEEIRAGAERVLAARRSGDESRFVSQEEVRLGY